MRQRQHILRVQKEIILPYKNHFLLLKHGTVIQLNVNIFGEVQWLNFESKWSMKSKQLSPLWKNTKNCHTDTFLFLGYYECTDQSLI